VLAENRREGAHRAARDEIVPLLCWRFSMINERERELMNGATVDERHHSHKRVSSVTKLVSGTPHHTTPRHTHKPRGIASLRRFAIQYFQHGAHQCLTYRLELATHCQPNGGHCRVGLGVEHARCLLVLYVHHSCSEKVGGLLDNLIKQSKTAPFLYSLLDVFCRHKLWKAACQFDLCFLHCLPSVRE